MLDINIENQKILNKRYADQLHARRIVIRRDLRLKKVAELKRMKAKKSDDAIGKILDPILFMLFLAAGFVLVLAIYKIWMVI
jgi:hypothetical protein